MLSFIGASTMIICGIIHVELLPANSPKVIGLLVAGFATLIFFIIWETFAPLRLSLTPPKLFRVNKGRRLTVPFICSFIVTMFYYGVNIIWGTMVAVYFDDPTAPRWKNLMLATVQGFGTGAGCAALVILGNRLGHWRLQMIVPFALMTMFGGLFAYVTPERKAAGVAVAFFTSFFFGFVEYLTTTFIQFGADQIDLGIVGGLGGAGRGGGGCIASSVFSTILTTVQTQWANTHVPAAAVAAGASANTARAILAAMPGGAAAVQKVPGVTLAIAEAAGAAYQQSYVEGVKYVAADPDGASYTLLTSSRKNVAYASVAFGGFAFLCCFFLEDISPRMNSRIEVFLENDVQAEKNVTH